MVARILLFSNDFDIVKRSFSALGENWRMIIQILKNELQIF